ncbi:Cytochrome c oxidase subunit 6B1 [Dermatophagoides pteronyssinus]|uniref:Cytochrome c oxidase subunit 6B1 n=1 Tax=Dermatophagoides pteronyssinus TaxID=6956 RepID=A0ABQ8ITX3_DERPT|nr:Cytochrome c oxidase subunit 6B1 [Dermatophagoides pteronyssinus]
MNVVEIKIEGDKAVVKNPEMLKGRGQTVPYDPRFPNTNQTRNCYQNYLDFFRCQKVKGEDYEPCSWYKFAYNELCPPGWTAKWDEQRENGVFPGRI